MFKIQLIALILASTTAFAGGTDIGSSVVKGNRCAAAALKQLSALGIGGGPEWVQECASSNADQSTRCHDQEQAIVAEIVAQLKVENEIINSSAIGSKAYNQAQAKSNAYQDAIDGLVDTSLNCDFY